MNNFRQKNIRYNLSGNTTMPNTFGTDISLKANQIIFTSINNAYQKMIDNDMYIERSILHSDNTKIGPLENSLTTEIDETVLDGTKYWSDLSSGDEITIYQKGAKPIEDTVSIISSDIGSYMFNFNGETYIASNKENGKLYKKNFVNNETGYNLVSLDILVGNDFVGDDTHASSTLRINKKIDFPAYDNISLVCTNDGIYNVVQNKMTMEMYFVKVSGINGVNVSDVVLYEDNTSAKLIYSVDGTLYSGEMTYRKSYGEENEGTYVISVNRISEIRLNDPVTLLFCSHTNKANVYYSTTNEVGKFSEKYSFILPERVTSITHEIKSVKIIDGTMYVICRGELYVLNSIGEFVSIFDSLAPDAYPSKTDMSWADFSDIYQLSDDFLVCGGNYLFYLSISDNNIDNNFIAPLLHLDNGYPKVSYYHPSTHDLFVVLGGDVEYKTVVCINASFDNMFRYKTSWILPSDMNYDFLKITKNSIPVTIISSSGLTGGDSIGIAGGYHNVWFSVDGTFSHNKDNPTFLSEAVTNKDYRLYGTDAGILQFRVNSTDTQNYNYTYFEQDTTLNLSGATLLGDYSYGNNEIYIANYGRFCNAYVSMNGVINHLSGHYFRDGKICQFVNFINYGEITPTVYFCYENGGIDVYGINDTFQLVRLGSYFNSRTFKSVYGLDNDWLAFVGSDNKIYTVRQSNGLPVENSIVATDRVLNGETMLTLDGSAYIFNDKSCEKIESSFARNIKSLSGTSNNVTAYMDSANAPMSSVVNKVVKSIHNTSTGTLVFSDNMVFRYYSSTNSNPEDSDFVGKFVPWLSCDATDSDIIGNVRVFCDRSLVGNAPMVVSRGDKVVYTVDVADQPIADSGLSTYPHTIWEENYTTREDGLANGNVMSGSFQSNVVGINVTNSHYSSANDSTTINYNIGNSPTVYTLANSLYYEFPQNLSNDSNENFVTEDLFEEVPTVPQENKDMLKDKTILFLNNYCDTDSGYDKSQTHDYIYYDSSTNRSNGTLYVTTTNTTWKNRILVPNVTLSSTCTSCWEELSDDLPTSWNMRRIESCDRNAVFLTDYGNYINHISALDTAMLVNDKLVIANPTDSSMFGRANLVMTGVENFNFARPNINDAYFVVLKRHSGTGSTISYSYVTGNGALSNTSDYIDINLSLSDLDSDEYFTTPEPPSDTYLHLTNDWDMYPRNATIYGNKIVVDLKCIIHSRYTSVLSNEEDVTLTSCAKYVVVGTLGHTYVNDTFDIYTLTGNLLVDLNQNGNDTSASSASLGGKTFGLDSLSSGIDRNSFKPIYTSTGENEQLIMNIDGSMFSLVVNPDESTNLTKLLLETNDGTSDTNDGRISAFEVMEGDLYVKYNTGRVADTLSGVTRYWNATTFYSHDVDGDFVFNSENNLTAQTYNTMRSYLYKYGFDETHDVFAMTVESYRNSTWDCKNVYYLYNYQFINDNGSLVARPWSGTLPSGLTTFTSVTDYGNMLFWGTNNGIYYLDVLTSDSFTPDSFNLSNLKKLSSVNGYVSDLTCGSWLGELAYIMDGEVYTIDVSRIRHTTTEESGFVFSPSTLETLQPEHVLLSTSLQSSVGGTPKLGYVTGFNYLSSYDVDRTDSVLVSYVNNTTRLSSLFFVQDGEHIWTFESGSDYYLSNDIPQSNLTIKDSKILGGEIVLATNSGLVTFDTLTHPNQFYRIENNLSTVDIGYMKYLGGNYCFRDTSVSASLSNSTNIEDDVEMNYSTIGIVVNEPVSSYVNGYTGNGTFSVVRDLSSIESYLYDVVSINPSEYRYILRCQNPEYSDEITMDKQYTYDTHSYTDRVPSVDFSLQHNDYSFYWLETFQNNIIGNIENKTNNGLSSVTLIVDDNGISLNQRYLVVDDGLSSPIFSFVSNGNDKFAMLSSGLYHSSSNTYTRFLEDISPQTKMYAYINVPKKVIGFDNVLCTFSDVGTNVMTNTLFNDIGSVTTSFQLTDDSHILGSDNGLTTIYDYDDASYYVINLDRSSGGSSVKSIQTTMYGSISPATSEYLSSYVVVFDTRITKTENFVTFTQILDTNTTYPFEYIEFDSLYRSIITTGRDVRQTKYEWVLEPSTTLGIQTSIENMLSVDSKTDEAIGKHNEEYHSAGKFLNTINNETIPVDCSIYPTWFTSSDTDTTFEIDNDMVLSVEYGDDSSQMFTAMYSNLNSTNKPLDLRGISYIIKYYRSGLKEIYIHLSSTNTYYYPHVDGFNGCTSSDNIFKRDSYVKDSDGNLSSGQTDISVIVNASKLDISEIYSCNVNGNSLPLSIRKYDGDSDGCYHSFILPTKVDMIDYSSNGTLDVCGSDNLISKADGFVLKMTVFGTDEQSVHLLAR